MEYILVGRIINTFGIKGELKVEIHTDFIDDRFKENSIIYIGEEHTEYVCKGYRIHKGYALLTLKNNEDINLVNHLKNNNIYIKESELKPLINGYYYKDLIGLKVFTDSKEIGEVIAVEDGLSSKYIRIKKQDNKTSLIPFIEVFIKNVDINKKVIEINNMEGLL